MYENISQVFREALPQRFNAPEAINQKGKFLFDIFNDTDSEFWSVTVNNGNLEIQEGKIEDPNCTLKMHVDDYLSMVNGRESIQMLYMTGKLKVEGDLTFAVRLARYFPADEKK